MTLFYQIAADIVVVLHLAYATFVVLGLPAIWIGILWKQKWARNIWWRCGHLAMILIVVFETWADIRCPLTTWEWRLRELAGQQTEAGDFLANFIHRWLFYDFPEWVFTTAYTLFGLLVAASFIVAPPVWPKRL